MSARFAIGIGARKAIDARELVDLVREVAARLGVDPRSATLATIETRGDEPGLREAARLLGIGVVFLSLEALCARDREVLTRSARVEEMLGLGSVAEAAALAGAGAGSALLEPRVATTRLACAIARAKDGGPSP